MNKIRKFRCVILLIIILILWHKDTVYSFNKSDILNEKENNYYTTQISYSDLISNNNLYCVDYGGPIDGEEDTYWMNSITKMKDKDIEYTYFKYNTLSDILLHNIQKVGPFSEIISEHYEAKMEYILSCDESYGSGYSNGYENTDKQLAIWKTWYMYCMERSKKFEQMGGILGTIFKLFGPSREIYNAGPDPKLCNIKTTDGCDRLLKEAEEYANNILNNKDNREKERISFYPSTWTIKANNLKDVSVKINSYTGIITGIYAYSGNEIVEAVDLNKVDIQNGSIINIKTTKDITNIKVYVASSSRKADIYILQNLESYKVQNEEEARERNRFRTKINIR